MASAEECLPCLQGCCSSSILRLEIIQEYDADNEMGKLDCSQSCHMFFLNQWLLECLPSSHAAKCQLNIKIDFI
uniref:Uncharacterized protein n=1 Tax=Nelumbo nucifera TaxID=4432 RepID=A0A822Y3Z4_NELNU|nr:TPA_asm: hypothetical protein HUJ06_028615 [Nelumbo nucifera]